MKRSVKILVVAAGLLALCSCDDEETTTTTVHSAPSGPVVPSTSNSTVPSGNGPGGGLGPVGPRGGY